MNRSVYECTQCDSFYLADPAEDIGCPGCDTDVDVVRITGPVDDDLVVDLAEFAAVIAKPRPMGALRAPSATISFWQQIARNTLGWKDHRFEYKPNK